jgi:hypothetical protein
MNTESTPRLVILALDLGTTTGWALRSANGPVAHGFVSFKSQRFEGGGMRYLRFGRWLADMLALSGSQTGSQTNLAAIGAIYFEEVRRHLGVDAAHVYGGLLAHHGYTVFYQAVSGPADCSTHSVAPWPGSHWGYVYFVSGS